MARAGKDFEKAVEAFCRHLDPNADCQFDVRVLDRDTGTPRQVDGWITLRPLGGHVAVSMLVSCKDHARPIDIQGVESCSAEMRSTGAAYGILYSRSGFSESAIAKGRALNIACCKLFTNQPPEVPAELFVEVFAAYPCYTMTAQARGEYDRQLRWHHFLKHPFLADPSIRYPAAHAICMTMSALFQRAASSTSAATGHDSLIEQIEVREAAFPPFDVHLALDWAWYTCKLNAYRISGSINYTDGAFTGSTTFPLLPLDRAPPSTQWTPCPPPVAPTSSLRHTLTVIAFPLPDDLLRATRAKRLFDNSLVRIGALQMPDVESLLLSKVANPFAQPLQMTTAFSIRPQGT